MRYECRASSVVEMLCMSLARTQRQGRRSAQFARIVRSTRRASAGIFVFSGIQRRNAGLCWAPVVTDQELGTISLLTNLEELDLGWGVALGAKDPALKGKPQTGEAECRIVGGIRVTDVGLSKLTALKHLRRLDISGPGWCLAGAPMGSRRLNATVPR